MGFSHVNSANASAAGTQTISVNLGNLPVAGELICVSLMTAVVVTGLTIKDGNNNSYTISPNSPFTSGSTTWKLWLAYLTFAPSNADSVITATWTSATTSSRMIGTNFSVNGGTAAFDSDAFNGFTTVNTTSFTGVTVVASKDHSLAWITASSFGSSNAPSDDGDLGIWTGAGIIASLISEYDLDFSGSQACQFGSASAVAWSGLGMTFTFTSVFQKSIQLVSSSMSVGPSSSTSLITLSLPVYVGNFLVVIASTGAATPANVINTITDTAGNVYTLAPGALVNNTAQDLEIWYAPVTVANDQNKQTVTWARSSSTRLIIVLQYQGTFVGPDKTVTSSGTAQTSLTTTAAATTTQPNQIVVAAFRIVTAQVVTTTGGMVQQGAFGNPPNLIVQDQIVTSKGAYTGTATAGSATNYLSALATFYVSDDFLILDRQFQLNIS